MDFGTSSVNETLSFERHYKFIIQYVPNGMASTELTERIIDGVFQCSPVGRWFLVKTGVYL